MGCITDTSLLLQRRFNYKVAGFFPLWEKSVDVTFFCGYSRQKDIPRHLLHVKSILYQISSRKEGMSIVLETVTSFMRLWHKCSDVGENHCWRHHKNMTEILSLFLYPGELQQWLIKDVEGWVQSLSDSDFWKGNHSRPVLVSDADNTFHCPWPNGSATRLMTNRQTHAFMRPRTGLFF